MSLNEKLSQFSENSETKKGTFRHKWIPILKSISVEPAILCTMTSCLMTHLISQNLYLENICLVDRNNSGSICEEIVKVNETFADEEVEIQKIFSQNQTYRAILDNALPLIFIMFVGPWSDHYGRKIPLLCSTLGWMTYPILTNFLSSRMYTMDPVLLMLLAGIPQCLMGSTFGLMMSANSYICDISNSYTRTVRLGILFACFNLGLPIGFSLAGQSIRRGWGYSKSYWISAVIGAVGVIIVFLRVKDVEYSERKRNTNLSQNDQQEENIESELKMGEKSEKVPGLLAAINPKNNFYQVLRFPFRRREDYDRLKIWLLLIAFTFASAPYHGEFPLMYVFLRERLNWDAVEYGDFSTYPSFISVAGVILSMGICSKLLKLSDQMVGFLGGISQFGGCILYAVAINKVMMYLAPAVDMMNGTMIVVSRSMMSKLVLPGEIGTLMSLISILDVLTPLCTVPLYSAVYRWTVATFSGSFIILSAVLTVPPQLIFIWFLWKKNSPEKRPNKPTCGNYQIQ
ncbi:proton-coupled folate transporter [Folsomia candida]|uniref:proton-coupled folate transporter n=1 Tax=Folsomia candida TaxID=158441 RepID=UPI001604D38D|nr:proton-coupled folate transporter [Folsomia candida]XP_035709573.1 proton-coupled folate transporter [Folsomia candida]